LCVGGSLAKEDHLVPSRLANEASREAATWIIKSGARVSEREANASKRSELSIFSFNAGFGSVLPAKMN
jgi:hypothetical protein